MENEVPKNVKREIDVGMICATVNFSHVTIGHGLLFRENVREYSRPPKGPLCPPLMVPW